MLLHLVAGAAAGLIRSRNTYQKFREEADEKEKLNQATERALAVSDPDEDLNHFLGKMAQSVSADRAYILESGTEAHEVRCTFQWHAPGYHNYEEKEIRSLILQFHHAWGFAYLFKEITAVSDISTLREAPELVRSLQEDQIHNFIQIPFTYEEHSAIVGFVNCSEATLQPPYTTYCMIASFIGSLLQHRDRIYRFRFLSNHDQMTGTGNRRALNDFCRQIHADTSLSLIYSDLNFLKEANDRHGHKAGDELIQRFSDILIENCPYEAGNGVFRMGGDEFLMVLTGGSQEQMDNIIHRLKLDFAKQKISASIGAVWKKDNRQPFHEVFQEADRRMYEDKKHWHRREQR